MAMGKVHDRFEFLTVLDMGPFFRNETKGEQKPTPPPQAAPNKEEDTSMTENPREHVHHLHYILLHSGDVQSRHYYAYI